MALFKNLFNNQDSNKVNEEFQWIELVSEDQLKSLLQDSHDNTQLIFKHSTRCFTSRMAKREFEKIYANTNDEVKFFHLDVIAERNLSNRIAEMFKVRHESPQLLVVRNGLVEVHASHGDIIDLPRQTA